MPISHIPRSFFIASTMLLLARLGHADTHYVSLAGQHIPPFADWSSAATNIQPAIDVAVDGDTVMVSNGTYYLSSQVVLMKPVTLKSLGGASATVLDGMASRRCVQMATNGVLDGFAIRNGSDVFGGGVAIDWSGGTVQNCIVRGNTAATSGGIECCGSGKIINTLITRNSAGSYGSGVRLRDGGYMESCTVVSNLSGGCGVYITSGGGPPPVILNSIIYYNETQNRVGSVTGMTNAYVCTTPAIAGTGNITNEPRFVNLGGDYHLMAGSPCIDAGGNRPWMATGTDLDGKPRIINGRVDMGAYECDPGPVIHITSAPSGEISYHLTSCLISGTNNLPVAGDMWWTNLTTGASAAFACTGLSWTCSASGLAEGSNTIHVLGSNALGSVSQDAATLRRGYERDLPLLDPMTNCSLREHQVLLRAITGRTNVTTVVCNADAAKGVSWYETATRRFSFVPDLGTAGQTWNILFIGVNTHSMETQALVVTVAEPAKGIGPRKPLRFEDTDGDILDIKYAGAKDAPSTVLFDGRRLMVSNAYAKGKLTLAIKRNKDSGDGSFELEDLSMDNDGKSATIGGNVNNVSLAGRRLGALSFSGKGGIVSNLAVGSAKTISASKGSIVGTVAASNGFETLAANVMIGGRILAGMPASANVSNTPAQATFKTVKVNVMWDSVVAGRDTNEGSKVVVPHVKVKTAGRSIFYHTGTNDLVTPEPILP